MQITRRDALLGATAAAVTTAAVTAPLAIKSAGVKAALVGDPAVDLGQQLRAAWQTWLSAMAAFDEIEDCGIPTCGKGGPNCALFQERARCESRFWELEPRLLDTPATTVGGVLAKLRGFYHDDEIARIKVGETPDPLPEEYVTSIYLDLERLAGEARS